VRATLRRDRVRIGVWIVAIVLLVWATAAGTKALFPTQADLDEAARASEDNVAALAFNGPAQALDTMGGQIAFQIVAPGALAIGLMALLMMSRLTRAEEESGRLELVRALPVGRHAPLASAAVVVGAMAVVTGVLSTVTLLASDLATAGSVSVGAGFAGVGLVFAGVTAVTAQVTENSRVASGLAGAVLAAAYLTRAVGDVGNGALSWLSPIGWAQKARPFAEEQWWPLLLMPLTAAVLGAVAVRLIDHRDVGAGLVAARPGPPTAAPSLASTSALARRLQRGTVLWWGVGVVGLAVSYGSITGSVDDFIGENEALNDIIARAGGALVDAYLSTSLLVMSIITGGFAIQAVARLRTEETNGRAEVVLATPSPRAGWAGSHIVVALAGAVVIQLAGGLGLGALGAITTGDAGVLPRVTVASLAYVPAVWVVAAIAVALFGLLPRWTVLAWVPLVIAVVFAMFGTVLDLPRAVLDVSPFEVTPDVPAADWDPLPLVVLVAVAGALVAAGVTGLRRRDVPA
jgi:ABC-2 type transport system permease protein